MNLIEKISKLKKHLGNKHFVRSFMKAAIIKREEVYKITETATKDVLNSLDCTERIGEKVPYKLWFAPSAKLLVGNFEDKTDAVMFMKHFGKFIAEFEKERGGGIVCIYNPDTDGLPQNGIM